MSLKERKKNFQVAFVLFYQWVFFHILAFSLPFLCVHWWCFFLTGVLSKTYNVKLVRLIICVYGVMPFSLWSIFVSCSCFTHLPSFSCFFRLCQIVNTQKTWPVIHLSDIKHAMPWFSLLLSSSIPSSVIKI